ncbi:hypothetical protein AB0D11_09525 [Streptomyces monashensis]|uniref:hypothetical protein n=1 Tax=Streptomyces monashensis TaxID=1678012 RepID=UPI0033FE4BA7
MIGSAAGRSGAHDDTVRTAATPRPTVTETAPAATDDSITGCCGSSGTCSIVSAAGNCHAAGEFCRTGDHGAATTDASGTPLTCSPSGSRRRWTES